MNAKNPSDEYALGSTDAEHERLIRQAAHLAPLTERFFRDAGIATGQRVLDLGSGVGDVAMLAARIVGPTGKVVGIERDSRSIARARARIAEAGVLNVSFTQTDANEIPEGEPFDAAVGRFILQFIPEPAGVLRSIARLVRPGGVVAFHEPQWGPFLKVLEPLPLTHACASLIRDTFRHAGVQTEMGLSLHRVYQEAGLPAPNMRMEMLMGSDPIFTRWVFDLFCTVRPQVQNLGLSLEKLGDLETLPERMQAEVMAAKTVAAWIALVGAWSKKQAS
jgi:SAM-dependent methyltransferase